MSLAFVGKAGTVSEAGGEWAQVDRFVMNSAWTKDFETRKTQPVLGLAILSHSNIKTHAQIALAEKHNGRTIFTPNARADGHPPVELYGDASVSYVDWVDQILIAHGFKNPEDGGRVKTHKGATIVFEDVYSASPEYWRAKYGNWKERTAEEIRADPLIERAIAFARIRHKGRLFSVVLHLDEETPHVHVLSVALHIKEDAVSRGRPRKDPNWVRPAKVAWTLCAGSEVRGGGWSLNQAQTDWADFVGHLGLIRGVDRSKLGAQEKREHRKLQTGRASQAGKAMREMFEAKMKEAQEVKEAGEKMMANARELIANAAAEGKAEGERLASAGEATAARLILEASKPIADAAARAAELVAGAEAKAKATATSAEAKAEAMVTGAQAKVDAAEAKAKASTDAADAKSKEAESAKADMEAKRRELSDWIVGESKRLADERTDAQAEKAKAKAAKKALDDERDAILEAAGKEAVKIKADALAALDDREAKVTAGEGELATRAKALEGREATMKIDRAKVLSDQARVDSVWDHVTSMQDRISDMMLPLIRYVNDFNATPEMDRTPAQTKRASMAKAAVLSDESKAYNELAAHAEALAKAMGRDG